MSPTARSLKHLRDAGCLADVVEKFIPRANIRRDLWNVLDILAIRPDGSLVGVQTTSGSNMASRRKKIAEHTNTPLIRRAGIEIWLHGWRKNAAGRWVLREENLS